MQDRRGANHTVICTCKWSLKGKTSDVLLTEAAKSGLDNGLGEVIASLNDQCSVEGSVVAFTILFLSGTWQGRTTGDRNGCSGDRVGCRQGRSGGQGTRVRVGVHESIPETRIQAQVMSRSHLGEGMLYWVWGPKGRPLNQ